MDIKAYLKENVKRKDLYTYLVNNLESEAENYINHWQDRYMKDDHRSKRDKVKEDLLNYHDRSEGYTKAEEALHRELMDEEIDIVYKAFNEEVLNKLE